MSLLSIPAELRLHVYTLLPDLSCASQAAIVTASGRIPAVAQVCRVLREETLSLLASNGAFAFELDDGSPVLRRRFSAWLDALGPRHLPQIRSLQFSRHWELAQPSRGVGHVGFYIKISSVPSRDELMCLPFDVAYGTYPLARDSTAMRYESVQLLDKVITGTLASRRARNLGRENLRRPGIGLRREDVEFVVAAVDIVARHPVLAYGWFGFEDSQVVQGRALADVEARLLTVA